MHRLYKLGIPIGYVFEPGGKLFFEVPHPTTTYQDSLKEHIISLAQQTNLGKNTILNIIDRPEGGPRKLPPHGGVNIDLLSEPLSENFLKLARFEHV